MNPQKTKRQSKTENKETSNENPYLRIFTLGDFVILKNGQPVRFSRKVQKKPLLMLKALIALGGKNAGKDQVSALLWPETEGDLVHKVFEITLHRLRRLIGNAGAIQLREGRLTLEPHNCWVDIWAFQHICDQVEYLFKDIGETAHKQTGEAVAMQSIVSQLSEKVLGIYKGHFLPGDSIYGWTASYRERLKSKFHRLIIRLGQYWEQTGHYEKAIGLFQKGLEIDDLVEPFYQRLMFCYLQLGQHAESVAVYHRCHAILSKTLGIEPSPKTEEIYHAIRAGKNNF